MFEDNCANNNDTENNINVSVVDVKKDSIFNTVKLLELYGNCEDTLKQILEHPETHNNEQPIYAELTDIYMRAESYRTTDTELYNALIATAYYKTYKFILEDLDSPDLYIDDTENAKGESKRKLNYNKVALALIKKYCIVSHNEIPYLYIGNQYYADENRKRLKKDITKILFTLSQSDYSKVTDIQRDIIDRIVNQTHKIKDYPFNELSNNLIPVINGVIHRKSKTLLPHSPVFKMLYRLNAEYKPDMDPKPVNDYLNSLVEIKDDADLLLQVVAQALLQNSQYQLAYIFTGDGSNGKSLFISFIEHFIGKKNYVSISLHKLTESKFAVADLEGKLMNLYPDLEKDSVKYIGIFKALTGSDEVQAERKFGAPFQLRNKAVFAFAANELPSINDATFAFWRRWCIIPFPHKFEANSSFAETLMTPDNMSIFLNLIINKMDRVELQGLTQSKRVENACKLWKTRSSSAYAFVQECIVKDINEKITKPNMENLYRAYCEEKDVTIEDFKNVARELQKLNVITARTRQDSKLIYVYAGCKYIKENVGLQYIPYVNEENEEEAPELKDREDLS